MLICVTNRKLCSGDFLYRIQQLAQAKPYALLLREKDLDICEYERLAWNVKEICERHGVLLIAHQHISVAAKLKLTHLQLSMADLRAYKQKGHSRLIGASIHSVAEAEEAQALGAAYLVAGHVYATSCKQGALPRGLPFLKQVCQAVTLPVFAIGGITGNHVPDILASGAKGYCVMSEAMTCKQPALFVQEFAIANNTKGSNCTRLKNDIIKVIIP